MKSKLPEVVRLDMLRCHLQNALSELEDLGKLPRFTQNIEFMLDELGEYIKLQKELESKE